MDKRYDKRIAFLDIVKGICICMIIITHYSWNSEERRKLLFPFWVDMAVPILMIISGYVYTMSIKKRNKHTLVELYSWRETLAKLIRFTLPFAVCFILEEIAYYRNGMLNISADSFGKIILAFIRGGVGPGSYYYPIMMEFVLIFPVVFHLIQNFQGRGVFICALINLGYEIFQRTCGMSEELYRLLVFRYIFLMAVGSFIALWGVKRIGIFARGTCFVLGFVFIICQSYLGYEPRIFSKWPGTSFAAVLFVVPIATCIFENMPQIRCFPLEVIGRASYNIFLTQMIWYALFYDRYGSVSQYGFINLVISLCVCIMTGIVFYYVETPFTRRFNRKILSV